MPMEELYSYRVSYACLSSWIWCLMPTLGQAILLIRRSEYLYLQKVQKKKCVRTKIGT